MKLYSRNDRLIYNLNGYENLDELFGILFSKCDSFSMYEYKYLDEQQIDFLFTMPNYQALKDSLIKVEYWYNDKKPCGTTLFFAINERSKEWILKNRDLLCFSSDWLKVLKESPRYVKKTGQGKKVRYGLTDLCFHSGDTDIVSTVMHEDQLWINDDFVDEFEQWAQKKCYENIGYVLRFMQEWNKLKGNISEEEFIERFSSDNYPIDIYLRFFDTYQLEVNKWKDFYKNPSNSELIAKVLVKKLKGVTNEDILSNLFCWFLCDKRNWMEPCRGIDEIIDFIVSLPSELFLKLFKKNLLRLSSMWGQSFRIAYLDVMVNIWTRKSLPAEKTGLKTFSAVLTAWNESCLFYPYGNPILFYKQYKMCAKKDALVCVINDELSGLSKKETAKTKNESLRDRVRDCYKKWILKDYNSTIPKVFETAAYEVIVDCQYDLADLYERGLGVEQDLEQAWYWFEQAKENGHPKAQERLNSLTESLRDMEM